MNNVCKIYNYLDEFAADLRQPENDVFKGKYLSSQSETEDYKKFSLTADYNEADELLRNGDKKALKRLVSCQPAEAPVSNVSRPRARVSRVGFAPHVANYLNGCPLNMIDRQRVRVPRRVVTIFYHMGCSGETKATEIAKVGANLLSAIKAVEASGVRVNLYVGKITAADKETAATFVRVKTDGQPLDETKVAYFLANPSFFRRHLFRWWETSPLITDTSFAWGYGASLSDLDKCKKFMENARVSYDKLVSFYSLRYQSADEILKTLTAN